MNFLWDKVTEWLKELLIGSIMSNLTGLFDNVNRQVAGIADNVGTTPQAWNGGVFGMIRNLSDNVILPIAGVILALVATLELIQMIVDRNNMHDMDTFMLAKWVFKTACAVALLTTSASTGNFRRSANWAPVVLATQCEGQGPPCALNEQ